MDFIISQTINGLVYSMLIFLLSAGLSLIFGMMRVINLAHGSFYMLGAYIGLTVVKYTGNFWLALVISPLTVGLLGFLIETTLFKPLYKREHLDQVLLTFGFIFIFVDVVKELWGAEIQTIEIPEILSGSMEIFGAIFPKYRIFVIFIGLALAFLLWLFIDKSRLGAVVRAGVDDSDMVSGIGINISLIFTLIFGLGVGLAAFGGVMAGPVFGLYPGMDVEILIITLIVVVVGGMGSLKGAFFGSLILGMADSFGKVLLPDFALFIVYVLMAIVLLFRPSGLFGVKIYGS